MWIMNSERENHFNFQKENDSMLPLADDCVLNSEKDYRFSFPNPRLRSSVEHLETLSILNKTTSTQTVDITRLSCNDLLETSDSLDIRKTCRFGRNCLWNSCPYFHSCVKYQIQNNKISSIQKKQTTSTTYSNSNSNNLLISSQNSVSIKERQKECKYGSTCIFIDNCPFYHTPKSTSVTNSVASSNVIAFKPQITSDTSPVSVVTKAAVPEGQKCCKFGPSCLFIANCPFYHANTSTFVLQNSLPNILSIDTMKSSRVIATAGQKICKYGSNCDFKENCSFLHLDNNSQKSISGSSTSSAYKFEALVTNSSSPYLVFPLVKNTLISPGQKVCKYGTNCEFKDNCVFFHPEVKSQTSKLVQSSDSIVEKTSQTSSDVIPKFTNSVLSKLYMNTKKTCRFSVDCSQIKTCSFSHPSRIFNNIISETTSNQSLTKSSVAYSSESSMCNSITDTSSDSSNVQTVSSNEVRSPKISWSNSKARLFSERLSEFSNESNSNRYQQSCTEIKAKMQSQEKPSQPENVVLLDSEKIPPEKPCKYGDQCIDIATCPFFHTGRIIPSPRIPKIMSVRQWFEKNHSEFYESFLLNFLSENNLGSIVDLQ